jgi:hypothetical protein
MGDHDTPGDKTSARLNARAARGLKKKSVGDGGEVFTGPLASRALKAVGARAMTLDESIVVNDGFDTNKPQDAALYAHESIHRSGSGGEGTANPRDAEEIAARATEAMVLHRSRAGEDIGSIMRDVQKGKGAKGKGGQSAKGKGGSGGKGKGGGKQSLKGGGGVGAKGSAPSKGGAGGKGGGGGGETDEATAAYQALLASGKTHDQIVAELAIFVVDSIRATEEQNHIRASATKTV